MQCRETSAVVRRALRPYLRFKTNWLTAASILWTWQPSDRTQNRHLGVGPRGRKGETGSKGQRQWEGSKI